MAPGPPLSSWLSRHGFAEAPYDALVIGLARPTPELDRRIAMRAETMLASGFLDEVRRLRAQGVDAGALALRAVGYREMLACLEGRLDRDGALAATVLATRQFAKRQRTWFRREAGIRWRHPEGDRDLVLREIEEFLGAA